MRGVSSFLRKLPGSKPENIVASIILIVVLIMSITMLIADGFTYLRIN